MEPGQTIQIDNEIFFEKGKIDLLPFAIESPENLAALMEKSKAAENEIGRELQELLKKWTQQAGITMLIQKAIEYQRTPAVEHTGNEWKTLSHDRQEISNMVYYMSAFTYEQTHYDRTLKKSVPDVWYVSWHLSIHAPDNRSKCIAGQDRKRFTDKAAAEKYLEGRKAYYEHLFYKISPPIPPEYADFFKVNGLLLPGYTVEGQEPPAVEKSAGKVLEELGGAFAPKQDKPHFTLDAEPSKRNSHKKGIER